MTTDVDTVTPATFWKALAGRATGVAVVTSQGCEGPAGFLALSVTHLTATPPTLLISVGKSTSALSAIVESKSLAVNYLADDLGNVADIFAGKTTLKGAERFKEVAWTTLSNGAPALDGAICVLECEVAELIERYDTYIVVAALKNFRSHPGRPLVHFGGKMTSLAVD